MSVSDFSSDAAQRFSYAMTLGAESANTWLLPDGVSDVLFSDAQKQEALRSQLIEQLLIQGYQLVSPPLIEYTESLLMNASEDLKRQTFKIIDQATGRLMGVRADITQQILRIDAHHGGEGVARYCYAGHVIHTMPTGLFGSRTPLQLGAEIFGCDDIKADFELSDVLIRLLSGLNLTASIHFDLGHVGIFTRLCELASLSTQQVEQLMRLYDNKALPELYELSKTLPMGKDFYHLALHGNDLQALLRNVSATVSSDDIILHAIDELQQLEKHLQETSDVSVSVDVTELSGYHYHVGLVFNAYIGNESQALVRGGRFLGNQSHQSNSQSLRSATGFSIDVTRLLSYVTLPVSQVVLADFTDVSNADDVAKSMLTTVVEELRANGHRVIIPLSIDDRPKEQTHDLRWLDGRWQLQAISNSMK